MGRDKNKVIHVFRGEGTLTPPSLTMSAAFEGWFLDWSLEHPFALLLPSSIKHEKNFIPESLVYASEYTFEDDGKVASKYRGLRWMKPVAYEPETDGRYSMLFRVLFDHFDSIIFMSHEVDTELRTLMDTYKNCRFD